jgi:hypothetical protein
MIFAKDIDVFLFFEQEIPKQIYLTAEVLNNQLKDLINNDIKIQNNIKYLWNVFITLYENKPKDLLKEITNIYQSKTPTELDENYKKIKLDFGTVKHWKGDINLN